MFITEIIQPEQYLLSATLYHGTPTKEGYLGIKEHGLEYRPDVVATKYQDHYSDMAPIEGGAYLSKEFGNAVRYSFMLAVSDEEYDDFRAREPNGYVFEFSGKDLTSVSPDEDELGNMVYDLVHAKSLPPKLQRIVDMLPNDIKAALNNDSDYMISTAGRWATNHFTHDTMRYLMRRYNNVVNYGNLRPHAVWVIPKPKEQFMKDRQGTFQTYNGYVNYAKRFGKRYEL